MTRVLFVSGTVPPDACGVGDYTFKLAQSLASVENFETAILTGSNSSAGTRTDNVSIYPWINSWRLGETRHLVRFLKRLKPDLVHIQYPTQGYGKGMLPYVLPAIARIIGLRSVQTWHEGFARRDALKLLLQLSAGSSKIVVRSNFLDLVHPALRWIVRMCRLHFIANASAIPRASCSMAELRQERQALLKGQSRLVVFFGFLYPFKGVELLFEVADPLTDQVVIAGAAEKDGAYHDKLKLLADHPRWRGRVTFTGFVSPERAAVILAASDAVVLPFRRGGGHWNTSLHSATVNGCFVITTSLDRSGYDAASNVFYTQPDDVGEMRRALESFGTRGRAFDPETVPYRDEWRTIAGEHRRIYGDLLPSKIARS